MHSLKNTLVLAGALALATPALSEAQTPASNRANPDLSVNFLTLARGGTDGAAEGAEAPNGVSIQEVEVRATSNIDSYFRGDVTLAIHPAHAHDGEEEAHGFEFDVEEAFAETLSIPSLTLKAGKFYAAMGRHNTLHTHAFPFIDAPLANEAILGEEGLNEIGLSASYLAPTPWFLEITAQGLQGANEELFDSPNNDLVGLVSVRNLWDLSDSSTLALDLSGAKGANALGGATSVYSIAGGYKWRPIEKTSYRSFSLMAEYLASRPDSDAASAQAGLSTWAQYQFNREWWLQGRYEYLTREIPAGSEDPMLLATRISGLVGYVPTEYSALRLQYDNIRPLGSETEHRVTLQLNVSMGAHPAHAY